MRLRLSRLLEYLGTAYWLLPTLCAVAAVGLSELALAADGRLPQGQQAWYLFGGGPEGARAVLSAVASSMMTFSGLVFSVTVLVLQQASNQFSPRVLRTFLRDRPSQLALGVFSGTFVYALLGLRSVWGASERVGRGAQVPSLTVWLAGVLAMLCVAAFIFYIHHVAHSIRAVTILGRIRDETRATLERMYPERVGEEAEAAEAAEAERPAGRPLRRVANPGRAGVLRGVDEARLLALACATDTALAVVPRVGDFVPEGGLLLEVWGPGPGPRVEALAAAVELGPERTLEQDTAFGFRQLVDVAERALSPGVNDPTTAVQALDQLHDLLRCLAGRRFPGPARRDAQGALRLYCPRPDWDSYVRLALDEVRDAGAGSVQVARRLRYLLEDVREAAPPARRPALERQLRLLEASVGQAFSDPDEAREASRPSPQGHGPH